MSVREKIWRQIREIEKTLYGIEDVIKIFCLSKATDLTIMLLGAHATAKSSLARVWSKTCGLEYRIVTSCYDEETEVLTENGWKSCLLYTSPSPRDISGSRMPSSA